MREVRIERMLPQEIRRYMDEVNLLYIPIAPLEWHGPHLPYGTDPLNACSVAVKAAETIGGLVHPPVYAGTEVKRPQEMVESFGLPGDTEVIGMDMLGLALKSLYLPPDAFKSMIKAIVETAVSAGWKRIVLLNGHGAVDQIRTLKELAAEMTGGGVEVTYFIDFDTGDGSLLKSIGHADRKETAFTLANHPELVHLENLPKEGSLKCREYAIVDSDTFECRPTPDCTTRSDPRAASAEEGGSMLEAVVARLAEVFGKEAKKCSE